LSLHVHFLFYQSFLKKHDDSESDAIEKLSRIIVDRNVHSYFIKEKNIRKILEERKEIKFK
jgi:hypothetical protein